MARCFHLTGNWKRKNLVDLTPYFHLTPMEIPVRSCDPRRCLRLSVPFGHLGVGPPFCFQDFLPYQNRGICHRAAVTYLFYAEWQMPSFYFYFYFYLESMQNDWAVLFLPSTYPFLANFAVLFMAKPRPWLKSGNYFPVPTGISLFPVNFLAFGTLLFDGCCSYY